MAKTNNDPERRPRNSIVDETVVPLVELPAPPDGGWGWVICLASFLCNTVLDGIAYSFGILLESLVIHFHSSRSSVAWVGSLLAGVYMASGPIVAGLVSIHI
jgi:MCP family monocarboxylic acid transporter-like MFS transporter 14